ncbi:hypothetical protein WJX84_005643 [Apatococcus fuscideae]|uniref:Uncharacterized protein n=1 Tax=Apatococcus fuscideae TaxID=2026836 RepID=A0AAW1T5N0_9CHLO
MDARGELLDPRVKRECADAFGVVLQQSALQQQHGPIITRHSAKVGSRVGYAGFDYIIDWSGNGNTFSDEMTTLRQQAAQCHYVDLVELMRETENEDLLTVFNIQNVIRKWLLPDITAQLSPDDIAVVTFWGDEPQAVGRPGLAAEFTRIMADICKRDTLQIVYLMGLAGTELDCCSLPPGRLDYLDIALPPIPLPLVASELQAQLTASGVEATMAADLMADTSILTCLYMTAGVPGYVVLLWQVMLEFWQASESRTAR